MPEKSDPYIIYDAEDLVKILAKNIEEAREDGWHFSVFYTHQLNPFDDDEMVTLGDVITMIAKDGAYYSNQEGE